jgi:hypothetical protein
MKNFNIGLSIEGKVKSQKSNEDNEKNEVNNSHEFLWKTTLFRENSQGLDNLLR